MFQERNYHWAWSFLHTNLSNEVHMLYLWNVFTNEMQNHLVLQIWQSPETYNQNLAKFLVRVVYQRQDKRKCVALWPRRSLGIAEMFSLQHVIFLHYFLQLKYYGNLNQITLIVHSKFEPSKKYFQWEATHNCGNCKLHVNTESFYFFSYLITGQLSCKPHY
jgi:hypothetical protein